MTTDSALDRKGLEGPITVEGENDDAVRFFKAAATQLAAKDARIAELEGERDEALARNREARRLIAATHKRAVTHEDCENTSCPICWGGLFQCADCGAAEIEAEERICVSAHPEALARPSVTEAACTGEAHDHPSHDWRTACLHCGVFRGSDLSAALSRPVEPVARPDWPNIYKGAAHTPDRDGEIVAVTRETVRLSLSAINASNAQEAYHNFMAAADELRRVLA